MARFLLSSIKYNLAVHHAEGAATVLRAARRGGVLRRGPYEGVLLALRGLLAGAWARGVLWSCKDGVSVGRSIAPKKAAI